MIMKRILLFSLAFVFAASTFAQRVYAPKELRNIALPQKSAVTEATNLNNSPVKPATPFELAEEDVTIGLT